MSVKEERIRQLCAEALAAQNDVAVEKVLPELQAALEEHMQNARTMAPTEIPRVFKRVKKAA
jgi:hypothetical protein